MSEARTISRRVCKGCGYLFDDPPYPEPWPKGYCAAHCWKAAKKPAKAPQSPRASLLRAKAGERPRRAVSTASAAQRAKRGVCIVTGDTENVDSAHLWDRSLGGCDDPDCIVPLRRDLHQAYDAHQLDLLPYLLAHGCVAELQHALGHARGDLIGLLNRLTGERYVPDRMAAAA